MSDIVIVIFDYIFIYESIQFFKKSKLNALFGGVLKIVYLKKIEMLFFLYR